MYKTVSFTGIYTFFNFCLYNLAKRINIDTQRQQYRSINWQWEVKLKWTPKNRRKKFDVNIGVLFSRLYERSRQSKFSLIQSSITRKDDF